MPFYLIEEMFSSVFSAHSCGQENTVCTELYRWKTAACDGLGTGIIIETVVRERYQKQKSRELDILF